MSIRNFEYLFRPKSIALLGASARRESIGGTLAANLLGAGFGGPVLPVNPNADAVQGVLCYRSVAELPLTPELAVIATPAPTVLPILAALAERGTRAAVIISAGFNAADKKALLNVARPHLMRIVGPNTLGVIAPWHGVNASFSHLAPQPGHLAFVTQSGAVVTSVIDWAAPRGIGFSHLVSLGDMADADLGDMLDYLANDPQTHGILLYVEGITQARKFMSAGRAAAREKPVIVVKAGRYPESAAAAASHTGALAGADDVCDAAIRRAGMLRVDSLEELFDAAETIASGQLPRGRRLCVLTNGGGMGVLAADELVAQGGQLSDLPATVFDELNRVLPPTWSKRNPIDIVGDAPPQRFAAALRAVLNVPEAADALLLLNCPTAVASPAQVAEAVVAALDATPVRSTDGLDGPGAAEAHGANVKPHPPAIPLLASWVGDATAKAGRIILRKRGIPNYETPKHAVSAFMHMVRFKENQDLLLQTVSSDALDGGIDSAAARRVIDVYLREHRSGGWLPPMAVQDLLGAYGIDIVSSYFAESPQAAAALMQQLQTPVVLKVQSADIPHKSDVGGVALNLHDATAVRLAAERMAARVAAARPDARLDGFVLQPMVVRPDAHELIVGMHVDEQFGPVLLFGQGGIAVEVIRDHALALPPLNAHLAADLIARTRVNALLHGYRGRPSADLNAITAVLLRLSQMVVDLPQLGSLDINPLLADAQGVCALDARVAVTPCAAGTDRLAIRAYPKALEEVVRRPSGEQWWLRPIRPDDEQTLRAALAQGKATLSSYQAHDLLLTARFTQIDYDRDMTFVAANERHAGPQGLLSLRADPDDERAELRLLATGRLVAAELLNAMLRYAKARGVRQLFVSVDRGAHVVMQAVLDAGFTVSSGNERGQVSERVNDVIRLARAP